MSRSIFYQHWRACLREHYLHVIRTHDHITEPTLRGVLKETGFTDEEIEALREEARQAPLVHYDDGEVGGSE